jgi:hypothetical protein
MTGHPAHSRSDERFGLPGRFVSIRVNPGAVLADVGHLEHVRVDPGPLARAAKGRLVHMGRARGHDDPINAKFFDVFFDQLLAQAGTHEFVIARDDHRL